MPPLVCLLFFLTLKKGIGILFCKAGWEKFPAKETKPAPFPLPHAGFAVALLRVSGAAVPGLGRLPSAGVEQLRPTLAWVPLPACLRTMGVAGWGGVHCLTASCPTPCGDSVSGRATQPFMWPGTAVGPHFGTPQPSQDKFCPRGPIFWEVTNNSLSCSKVYSSFICKGRVSPQCPVLGTGCWLSFLLVKLIEMHHIVEEGVGCSVALQPGVEVNHCLHL